MAAHLVVIDLQKVFGDPASGWFCPRFGEILDPIAKLVAAYAPAVTFTRFVAPATPAGAWREYYEQWPWALRPADSALYSLVDPYTDRPSLAATTFGKWSPELAARVGPELVVAGVSTDCCVLSTVLPAADAGVKVRIAADACAGSDDDTQRQALTLLGLYAPLIEISSVAALTAAPRGTG